MTVRDHLYGSKKRSSAFRIWNQLEDLSNFADMYGPSATNACNASSNPMERARVGLPDEPLFTVKVSVVMSGAAEGSGDKAKASVAETESTGSVDGYTKGGLDIVAEGMQVPENFSKIQIPNKRPSSEHGAHFSLGYDGASQSNPSCQRVAFVEEDAGPWDDPETGYQLMSFDNLEGASTKVLGFDSSLQVAEGTAPCPLTWPLGKLHLAHISNHNSSVLAPARAPPSLRSSRPRSAPSFRPQVPPPVPLAEEIRGILRATPTNLLLSPREAQLLEEEAAPRFAQKARLAGKGSSFPNQYLASLPVQVHEAGRVAETISGHLLSQSKSVPKDVAPSGLRVNGMQMCRVSSTEAFMVTNASWAPIPSTGSRQVIPELRPKKSSTEAYHHQIPSAGKIVHMPNCSKPSESADSIEEPQRQRPASAPGVRASCSTESSAKLQQQRPVSAKVQQVTVFAENHMMEQKRQRPASAMALHATGQAAKGSVDERCRHQFVDVSFELGDGFQASGHFGSFPPRARPKSRPQSAPSSRDAQATADVHTLKTPFGFGSFPVKAAERYCRRGRRDPEKVDRAAARAPTSKRPMSAPAARSGCESKSARANKC